MPSVRHSSDCQGPLPATVPEELMARPSAGGTWTLSARTCVLPSGSHLTAPPTFAALIDPPAMRPESSMAWAHTSVSR